MEPFRHHSFWDQSDLNTMVTSTWMVETTCCVQVRSECALVIGTTQRAQFDPTQCACLPTQHVESESVYSRLPAGPIKGARITR